MCWWHGMLGASHTHCSVVAPFEVGIGQDADAPGTLHLTHAAAAQVDKAEQDKQGAILRAQGEAQSAKLIGEAIQSNPAFLTLRKIEVLALAVALAFPVRWSLTNGSACLCSCPGCPQPGMQGFSFECSADHAWVNKPPHLLYSPLQTLAVTEFL